MTASPYLHTDPPTGARVATAPYNFIPLPEKVLAAEELHAGGPDARPWVNHHRILDGHLSGHLDISITTKTPTFTRGARLRVENDGDWDPTEARLRQDPMTSLEGVPILPGSTIRGAVRSLFEILTFSKLVPVTDKKRFYRTLPPARIGKIYQEQMISGDEKPRAGYLRQEGDRWFIDQAEAVQVRHTVLQQADDLPVPFRFEERKPNYRPHDRLHKLLVWFEQSQEGRVTGVYQNEQPGLRAGTLVLSGAVRKKKNEFIFCKMEGAETVEIPEQVWEDFNSDRQISEWQEKRFPSGRDGRPVNGAAAEGDPVFYLAHDGRVQFFGRARMFRLPYDKSPADLLPEDHRADAPLDMTETVFGSVNQDRAIKGRVSFSTAVAGERPDSGWFDEPFVPAMLSSPKPTCYPHYLVQDGNLGPEKQTTYLAKDRTSLRGHKLYWHRPTKSPGHVGTDVTVRNVGENAGRMHTVIKPVKSGITFRGRIRFTNLTEVELGALITAIDLPDGCAHKIGMAKSLGLGSVRFESTLTLADPVVRYRPMAERPATVDSASAKQRCRTAFEEVVSSHAEATGELTSDRPGLRRLDRLDALYLMLGFESAPEDPAKTDHMDVNKGQFRDRLVLPSPHGVAGLGGVAAPLNRRPEAGESDYTPPSQGGRGRGGNRGGRGQRRDRGGAPKLVDRRPKGIVQMVVSEQTTRKGAPILEHETGRYVFAPTAQPPEPPSPGETLKVQVKVAASGPNTGQVEYQGAVGEP